MRFLFGLLVLFFAIHLFASVSIHPTLDPFFLSLSQSLWALNPTNILTSVLGLFRASVDVITQAVRLPQLLPIMFFFALLHG
jgi:hypothetical protein